ncbi:MAG: hypothetical protein V8R52_07610 [Coprobacter fastidiosus]
MEKENEIKTVIPVLNIPRIYKHGKGWKIILIGKYRRNLRRFNWKKKQNRFWLREKNMLLISKCIIIHLLISLIVILFVLIVPKEQNLVKFGDILFTQSSETPEEVGISSVMLNETNEAIYLNSFCFGLRPFDLKRYLRISLNIYLEVRYLEIESFP